MMQILIFILTLTTIFTIAFREKKLYRYGSAGLTLLVLGAHLLLMNSLG